MRLLLNSGGFVVAGLLFAMVASVSAQTTNFIPTNTFVTDDGKVFWYRHGRQLVDIRKIEQAKKSQESRPAEQDPQGNWGEQADGFQLSLRFEKQTFTNGEDIAAIMLMRNVTTNSQTYFRPTYVVAMKDGKPVKKLHNTAMKEMMVSPETTIFPQTQHEYREHLRQEYNLSESGEYIFQAVCRRSQVTSQKVSILVTNTP
jgi:hypothetical protein